VKEALFPARRRPAGSLRKTLCFQSDPRTFSPCFRAFLRDTSGHIPEGAILETAQEKRAPSAVPAAGEYSADSIKVLEGPGGGPQRPHMYIRGVGAEGLHNLVYEVVDNSVDEALVGHASIIELTIHANGSLSGAGQRRGIPVGPHPTEPMDTLDVVMTKAARGRKFDGNSGS